MRCSKCKKKKLAGDVFFPGKVCESCRLGLIEVTPGQFVAPELLEGCQVCMGVFQAETMAGEGICDGCWNKEIPIKTEETQVKKKAEAVNHPAHYGGAEDPFETIKVMEAWSIRWGKVRASVPVIVCLSNTLKYLGRCGSKGDPVECLKKARWYLDRAISHLEAPS